MNKISQAAVVQKIKREKAERNRGRIFFGLFALFFYLLLLPLFFLRRFFGKITFRLFVQVPRREKHRIHNIIPPSNFGLEKYL